MGAMSTRERPILFSGPMIRAILADRKTQTRRIVKVPGGHVFDFMDLTKPRAYRPGDRLWVRETWAKAGEVGDRVEYRADNPDPESARWRPCIHMPRWASRITLEVTGVCIDRLQRISEADAKAEGVDPYEQPCGPAHPHALAFRELWDSFNGKRAPWASNPWVWVVSFKRLEATS